MVFVIKNGDESEIGKKTSFIGAASSLQLCFGGTGWLVSMG
jgi:hypothetical protein